MNNSLNSETDVCMRYITPALVEANWDIHTQIKREYSFTDGRIIVRGNVAIRGKKKAIDYLLSYKSNLPLAIIEAKKDSKSVGAGIEQALAYADGLKYAKQLDVPFVYSSNGKGFLEHDMTTGQERFINMDEFPSPEELWIRYNGKKGFGEEQQSIIQQDYYYEQGWRIPRYYQRIAVNRTVEDIVNGQNRILLVMATGTGKTLTAFQIAYRLWKSKTKKRILFIADRNILVDQAMSGDFTPFKDKMVKLDRNNVSKAYELYMALYQSMTGTEDWQQTFTQFSPDFFDLVIIDECHRGSAKADSMWRSVLDYFTNATHIGLTATPKETKYISNINYFGEPVYTYSLKQGIEDGFLAPYKVRRLLIDKDQTGFRPYKGQLDKNGLEIDDREYNISDYDRTLVLEARTEVVAKETLEYMDIIGDPYAKTIIFCEDIDHAERMRNAIAQQAPKRMKENHHYVMRLTGDNPETPAQLDNFIDPKKRYPVIATTSKLLTTGVDAKTCKIIVIDSNINSMTEFKQIIGRGTRVREDYGKMYFTIMDFRNVTRLFADPEFDGEPIQDDSFDDTYTVSGGGQAIGGEVGNDEDDDSNPRVKFTLSKNQVGAKTLMIREQFIGADGKLITEDYKKFFKDTLKGEYPSLKDFLTRWDEEERKNAILEELYEHDIIPEILFDEIGSDIDIFDLICHIAYDMKPLTKKERAENVKKRNYFTKYGDVARLVLDTLLDKYQSGGIADIEDIKVLKLEEFRKIGSAGQIIKAFGGRDKYLEAIKELEQNIYQEA